MELNGVKGRMLDTQMSFISLYLLLSSLFPPPRGRLGGGFSSLPFGRGQGLVPIPHLSSFIHHYIHAVAPNAPAIADAIAIINFNTVCHTFFLFSIVFLNLMINILCYLRSSGGSLACKYSFLRILGFKGFLEFVLVGCGSAYPPENLLNQSGRYADLPLQQANPNRSSFISHPNYGVQTYA